MVLRRGRRSVATPTSRFHGGQDDAVGDGDGSARSPNACELLSMNGASVVSRLLGPAGAAVSATATDSAAAHEESSVQSVSTTAYQEPPVDGSCAAVGALLSGADLTKLPDQVRSRGASQRCRTKCSLNGLSLRRTQLLS